MIEALAMYGDYLMGQMSGMSEALDLTAVIAACEIEGIAREDRPALAQDLLVIHSQVMKVMHARARRSGRG